MDRTFFPLQVEENSKTDLRDFILCFFLKEFTVVFPKQKLKKNKTKNKKYTTVNPLKKKLMVLFFFCQIFAKNQKEFSRFSTILAV